MYGKPISEEIYKKLKKRLIGKRAGLGIVLVGDDPASIKYVSIKCKKCNELNINNTLIHLDKTAKIEAIQNAIQSLNTDSSITGIIVQLPLPENINDVAVFSGISEDKDIEGLNPTNMGKLVYGKDVQTVLPKVITTFLDYYNINVSSKEAVIINDSILIGKPLAHILLKRKATVTICHSKTKDLKMHTKNADIIISAVGKPKIITKDMVKENAVIFDLGFSSVGGKIIGDIDFDKVKEKCTYITPNPGGVGPVTVAVLLEEVVNNGY